MLELLKHLFVNWLFAYLVTSQFKFFAHFLEYSNFLIDWEVAMGFPIINWILLCSYHLTYILQLQMCVKEGLRATIYVP